MSARARSHTRTHRMRACLSVGASVSACFTLENGWEGGKERGGGGYGRRGEGGGTMGKGRVAKKWGEKRGGG